MVPSQRMIKSILDYLSNKYGNFREKYRSTLVIVHLSQMHQIICLNMIIVWRIAVIIVQCYVSLATDLNWIFILKLIGCCYVSSITYSMFRFVCTVF